MDNPILINARLKVKRSAVKSNESKLAELEARQMEILRAAEDATTEDDVDKATSDADEVTNQIDKLKKDTETLNSDIADLETKLEKLNDTDDASDEGVDDDTEEGTRKMAKKVIHRENDKEKAETRGIIDFVNSKGQNRAGVTTADVGAIIPKQIIYEAEDEITTTYDLSKYVDVVKVTTPGGTWNVAKKIDESLHTVTELDANPELKHPELITLNYAVKTYRGAIQNSNEAIQDAPELKRLLAKALEEYVLNTKNRVIVEVLKTATPKDAPTVDDIKHVVNVDLDPAYNKVVIASQSGFNYLDTLKDNDGRYLLQPDVTSASGKRLLGMEVQVVADNLLGEKAGDQVAFIGDAKRFAKFFDRDQVQIGWATNENFAQNLLIAIRADIKAADTAAGFLVTLGGAVTAPEA